MIVITIQAYMNLLAIAACRQHGGGISEVRIVAPQFYPAFFMWVGPMYSLGFEKRKSWRQTGVQQHH
jgi:hypothetical protein